MQDNSTNDKIETLIRYMDGELNAEEQVAAEALLKNDVELQQRYQQLLTARAAIKREGLKQRVQAIHNEFKHEQQTAGSFKQPVVKRVSFLKTFMRIAAILILVIAGYGLFQYSTTTNDSVFADNYINYTAYVSRGETPENNLADLYNTGKYNEAVLYFNTVVEKSRQDYFIAAQSYLQLNNAKAAIDNFRQLQNLNAGSDKKFFEQETEYYLMLAYIKDGNIEAAENLLDQITADKKHLFYNNAKDISNLKLKILKAKNK